MQNAENLLCERRKNACQGELVSSPEVVSSSMRLKGDMMDAGMTGQAPDYTSTSLVEHTIFGREDIVDKAIRELRAGDRKSVV